MSGSVYRATQPLTQFKVVFANWAFDGSTNEVPVGCGQTFQGAKAVVVRMALKTVFIFVFPSELLFD